MIIIVINNISLFSFYLKILHSTIGICISINNIFCEISISYCIGILPYRWITTFNPLDCFTIHFETILTRFFRILGFRSPVYPALARILHWHMARSKRLNKGVLTLSDLELPAMPYAAPITAISRLPEHRLYYAHEIVLWICGKVICDSQKYTRDHWVMQRKAF